MSTEQPGAGTELWAAQVRSSLAWGLKAHFYASQKTQCCELLKNNQPCAEISQTSCQPPRMMRVGYLVQHHQLERRRNHTLKFILFNSFCTSSYGHVRVKLNDVPACAVPLPAQCLCGQLGLSSGKGNREDEGSTTIHVWCCLPKNNNILT